MGNTSSMLTQYDIEEVQEYCQNQFSPQEIVSLYQRFCQLDRNAKGFISADEFLSVPEFALNPLSQGMPLLKNWDFSGCGYLPSYYFFIGLRRLLRMIDGLNFKDFVAFLSSFSPRASLQQKIEVIFKVYDSDCNGKVIFNDVLEVLKDLTGTFISEKQREHVLVHVLEEAVYSKECTLTLDDFIKILSKSGLKMDVEVPVD